MAGYCDGMSGSTSWTGGKEPLVGQRGTIARDLTRVSLQSLWNLESHRAGNFQCSNWDGPSQIRAVDVLSKSSNSKEISLLGRPCQEGKEYNGAQKWDQNTALSLALPLPTQPSVSSAPPDSSCQSPRKAAADGGPLHGVA